MILSKKEWLLLGLVFLVFLAVRVPGVHSPYHQDEYKWVLYSHPEIIPPGTVPHPPLTEFIYTEIGPLVGDNNFRLIPLSFSILNFFLLFYLARRFFGIHSAFVVVSLFTLSFYSALASLMVDVDGSVMPFFLLLTLIGYYRLRESNFELQKTNLKWLGLLVLGALGGFLIKVVFVLPLAALALDFAVEKGVFKDKRKLFKYGGSGLLVVIALALVLILSKYVFPFFNLSYALKYWEHFVVFSGRGWLQTFIQFAKALMYLSPLLVLPVFFTDKEIFQKNRPFFFFIFIGLLFYLFVFDFSLGALDRYFQFLVLPLCVISGSIIAKAYSSEADKICKPDIAAVTLISLGIFALQFFDQFVPPLYPKTEWLSRLVSFKWNFLFPFTGGSGPLPFYVSFQFIALLWAVSTVFVAIALFGRQVIKRSLFALVIFGLVYNAVFLEEYLLGKVNGSSKELVGESVEFIKNEPSIKRVIVYNDNGGWQVRAMGKYERRMYATPQFELEYRELLSKFSGHILYVNAPRVADDSFYASYFRSCRTMFEKMDKSISAKVLECN